MSKINGITVGTTMPRTNYNQTDPKKADYLVGRENILDKTEIRLEKGEGEGSIQQYGANAIGPNTIALGTSVAGCKGYYYSGIDFTNKYIYLSLSQSVPVVISKVIVSAPANLKADADRYCVITTNGTQVSLVNLTLNDYSTSLEYRVRVDGISKIQIFTPDDKVVSIQTLEASKIYDITIISGVAQYTVSNEKDPFYDASFTPEWQVGDAFSIVNSSHYDEIGTITSIDGNRIGYDTIGFDEINLNDASLEDFDSYTIVVPTRPECGVINLGEGAFAASDGGIAAGRFSVNFARNGRNIGDYSFNVGRDNVVAYSSATFGAFLKHLAKWGLSAGWSNETLADYAITLGGGLINPYECGLIGGWCNDPTIPDLLFGIGYGFDGVRKNAFNINKYGDVWVDKDPTKPMGVATKQYVDLVASPVLTLKTSTLERGTVLDQVIPLETIKDYVENKEVRLVYKQSNVIEIMPLCKADFNSYVNLLYFKGLRADDSTSLDTNNVTIKMSNDGTLSIYSVSYTDL